MRCDAVESAGYVPLGIRQVPVRLPAKSRRADAVRKYLGLPRLRRPHRRLVSVDTYKDHVTGAVHRKLRYAPRSELA